MVNSVANTRDESSRLALFHGKVLPPGDDFALGEDEDERETRCDEKASWLNNFINPQGQYQVVFVLEMIHTC